jgi:hypothetical protein
MASCPMGGCAPWFIMPVPTIEAQLGVSLEVLSQVMPVNFYFHSVLVHCQRSVHAFAHTNSEVYSVLEVLASSCLASCNHLIFIRSFRCCPRPWTNFHGLSSVLHPKRHRLVRMCFVFHGVINDEFLSNPLLCGVEFVPSSWWRRWRYQASNVRSKQSCNFWPCPNFAVTLEKSEMVLCFATGGITLEKSEIVSNPFSALRPS